MKNSTVLWIIAGVLCICSLGMQIPNFDADFQNLFTWITGILTAIVGTAALPKIPPKYQKLILFLLTCLSKLIKKKKESSFDEAYFNDQSEFTGRKD